MKTKLSFENILLLFIFTIGVSVSIFQFLYNRSLWLDESYLALNIINRSFLELLQPLNYEQVAPILFLYIEKLFTGIFGLSEYALRIFPLLSYWASIYFLYRILKILNQNIYVTLLSLSLFIFNGTIIYYSSEVKQYMTDVMVITCMFYFTLKNQESLSKKYFLLGLLGTISIFLSNVSPIILLCCGTYLFYEDLKNGWKEIKYIFGISFLWTAFFGIYFMFFIYDHPTREFMVRYWSRWDGGAFMPLNPLSIEFYQFVIKKYYFFYTDLFQFGNVGLYGLQLLFLLGCYHLIEQKKYNLFILGVLPIALHLALSSLKLYPFDIRLILYTCPAFIIILSAGFEYIFYSIKSRRQALVRIPFAITMLFFLYTAYSNIPRKSFEPRECFFYINKHIQPNDQIYASQYSKFPLKYYMGSSQVDFSKHTIYTGEYGPIEDFDQEIESLKGRVWFVFSDFLEYYLAEHFKKKHMDGKHKLVDEFKADGVRVFLYEIAE